MKKQTLILLLFALWLVSASAQKKAVVMELNNTVLELKDMRKISVNGVIYINSYWLEVGGIDANKDGVIKHVQLLCKIPKGCKDIDLSTLKPYCLKL